MNGFHFSVSPEQPAGKRAKLTALPFSKNTQFGVEGTREEVKSSISSYSLNFYGCTDIHELASLLSDRQYSVAGDSNGRVARLPKTQSMLASRACRSSVMIGRALERPKMESIVQHLSALERPWNCPHGRPTLRHLIDLSTIPRPRQLPAVRRATKR